MKNVRTIQTVKRRGLNEKKTPLDPCIKGRVRTETPQDNFVLLQKNPRSNLTLINERNEFFETFEGGCKFYGEANVCAMHKKVTS